MLQETLAKACMLAVLSMILECATILPIWAFDSI
jgi:hypothetical protein